MKTKAEMINKILENAEREDLESWARFHLEELSERTIKEEYDKWSYEDD